MYDLLDSIAMSPLGDYMAASSYAFPAVETIHVMAITTVIGFIAMVDLRLMGLASLSYPITRLSRALLPTTWIAFVISVISGAVLFTSQPASYFDNTAFRVKMLLIVLAGLNMLVFHHLTMRNIQQWDRDGAVPFAARIAGFSSLVIWVLVVAFGRWIGFTNSPF
jgi:hypothetical protein